MDPDFILKKEVSSNLNGSSVGQRATWAGERLKNLVNRVVGWR